MVRDIAYDEENNLICLATSATGDPVRCFNTQSQVVTTLSTSIGIGDNICGLTMAVVEGHRILWASDLTTDKIYKIDLDYTTSINNHTFIQSGHINDIVCRVDHTLKKVVIQNRNLNQQDKPVSLILYTIQGDRVFSSVFHGKYTWNGYSHVGKPVAQGMYLLQVKAGFWEQSMVIHKSW